MSITNEQKKIYRTIGHRLKPIVMVSENGLSEGVLDELERALNDHELIKIKIAVVDREAKHALIAHMVEHSGAELVQQIGKTALLLRRNPNAKPRLSNLN